jgi:hypothetical protein
MAGLDSEFDKATDLSAAFDAEADSAAPQQPALDLPADVEPNSPLGKAWGSAQGDFIDVDDPVAGKATFDRNGRRILSGEEQRLAEPKDNLDTMNKVVGTLSSGANGVLPYMAGAYEAAKAPFSTSKEGIVDAFRRGKTSASREAGHAENEAGLMYQLIGKGPQVLFNPGSAGGRVALSALTSGAEGALKSKGDTLGEVARDGAIHGGIGAATGGLGEGVGWAVAKGAGKLADFSREAMIRAIDPTKRDATKLLNLGMAGPVAEELLRMVKFTDTRAKLGDRVGSEVAKRGEALGAHTDRLGEAVPSVIAERITTDVVDPLRARVSSEAATAANYAAEQAANIEAKYGKGVMKLTDAERLIKGDFADAAAKSAMTNDSAGVGLRDVKAEIYRAVKRQNEDLALASENHIAEKMMRPQRSGTSWVGTPASEATVAEAKALPGTFKRLKSEYGAVAEADRILNNGRTRPLTNRTFPSETTVNVNLAPDKPPAQETFIESLKTLAKDPVGLGLNLAGGVVGAISKDRGPIMSAVAAKRGGQFLGVVAPYMPQAIGKIGASKQSLTATNRAAGFVGAVDQRDEEAIQAWIDNAY